MRKLLLLLAICGMCSKTHAQTMQEKLYYTCKVWGFVKYYHSEVSVCNVNWDSVLLAVLPDVRSATTSTDFNDALMDMLNAAGPMALSTTYFPDTLPAELKRNRDFSWMTSTVLRPDVRTILDTIKNNFRPHAGCYVEVPASPSYNPANYAGGYLAFPYDSIMLPVATYITHPDQDHRLLQMFKFWNIVRYFNPYNYILDKPWDTTLAHFVEPISIAPSAGNLHLLYEKITATLDDTHVEGFTRSDYYWKFPYYWKPPVRLAYMNGQYVVYKTSVPGITPGDVLVSLNGLTTTQWEDSLRKFISAGNDPVFRREMCSQMLGNMYNGGTELLGLKDSTGAAYPKTVTCVNPGTISSVLYGFNYYADSLETIKSTTMPCDIGYVNMANIADYTDADNAYAALKDKDAIIFDFRYEAYAAHAFADLMYPSVLENHKLTIPDPEYPGTYYWEHQYGGSTSPVQPYTGKVILLIGPGAQSHVEWHCMIMEALPNVIKVGDLTAGADGNITFLSLSNDQHFGWTSMGVYYPNGDSTQKVGLIPDTFAYQTADAFRQGRDVVLEKGLSIAGCGLFSNTQTISNTKPSVFVYPNPANDNVTIKVSNIIEPNITIYITDISGRVLEQTTMNKVASSISTSINISKLLTGLYFVNVKANGRNFVTKLVKQ